MPLRVFPIGVVPGHKIHFWDDWGQPRNGGRKHEGNDLFAVRGDPLLAVDDGIIKPAAQYGGGPALSLKASDGTGYFYGHLTAFEGDPNRAVKMGDVIGYVGTSGNAAGTPPHCHFEIHPGGGGPVDPYPYLMAAPRQLAQPILTTSNAPSPSKKEIETIQGLQAGVIAAAGTVLGYVAWQMWNARRV